MKQIKTFSNSFVLQETDENGRVIFQMGYPKGGLNYLIKNGSIKFFLTEDYFYKNVVWGANIPLVVDGVSYGETALPAALKKIFENVNGSGETITVDTELDEESLNPIANSPVALKFDEIEAEMADIQSGMVETSAFTAFSASVETELDNKLDASAYTPTDLSNYYTKDETSGATQISEALSGKQDTLIAGENITISGNVISASGGSQITVDSQLSPTSENPVQNKVLYDQLVVSGGSSGFVPYSTSVESFTVPGVHAIKLDTTQTSIDPRGMQFTLRSSSAETGYTVIGSGVWSHQDNEWVLGIGLGDVTCSVENGIITFNSPSATIGYVWLLFFDKLTTYIEGEGGFTYLKDVVSAHTANTAIHVTAEDKTTWNNKSDFSGSYNDLTDKPTIPTSASQLTNDVGYITSGDVQSQIDSSISGKVNTSDFNSYSGAVDSRLLEDERVTSAALNVLNTNKLDASAYTPTDLSNYYTKSETNDEIDEAVSGKTSESAFTSHTGDSSIHLTTGDVQSQIDSSISGKTNQSDFSAHTANTDIHVTTADKTAWNAKSDFSGSYNDLTDKPTIPTSASQLTNDAGYITEDAISGKVDTSAFTSYSGTIDSRLAEDEETTAAALNDLNENKLDASAYTPTDLSQYWTSAQTQSAITSAVSGKQDTLSAGTGIDITDNVISATGGSGGGNPTVELTQAEYDALVSGGTVDPTTYYIITDATPIDINNYYTTAQTDSAISAATSGKVDTSSVVIAVTSASTDSEIPTAKAVYDAVGQGGGGGGKAISAGTNISVTTGETADTVSCTLPITANSSMIKSVSIGAGNSVPNQCDGSIAVGYYCSFPNTGADGAAAIGWYCNAKKDFSFAQGNKINANNTSEHSVGQYNVSSSGSSIFGNSGNTLFSVGNGTADNARHNAFEIRQNGDIYITSGGTDIKLQDNLGGGVSEATFSAYTASTNSRLAEDEEVTAAALNNLSDNFGGLKLMKLTQSEYDALVSGGTVDADTLYVIVSGSTPTPSGWTLYSAGSSPSGDFTNLRISQSVASGLSEDENFQISYYDEGTGIGYTWTIGNQCTASTCDEYCCRDYDPETGECIDWDSTCCGTEECLGHDNGYVFDDYQGGASFVPFSFTDGYWTLNPGISFNFSAQIPFDIELMV